MLVITTLLVLLFIGLVNRVVIKPINSLAAAAVSYVEEKRRPAGKMAGPPWKSWRSTREMRWKTCAWRYSRWNRISTDILKI